MAPNFLFLVAHDISRRLGCYGDPLAVTPCLDELAARGLTFTNHSCQYALCAPSRTNMMTGCRPATVRRFDIGANDFYAGLRNRLPHLRTLPELLRGAGYRTQSLHKVLHEYEQDPPSWTEPPWYASVGEVPDWCPDDFDCVERARRYRSADNRALMRARFDAVVGADPSAATEFKRWRGGAVEGADVDDESYYPGETASEAAAMLADLGAASAARAAAGAEAEPFFLGVGFCNTHLPWLAPQRYWRLHDRAAFGQHAGFDSPLPAGVPLELARAGNEPYQYFAQDYHVPGASAAWRPDAATAMLLRHGYYAAVSYLDAQIGRILAALEASGLADSTVVVFTADHGFALGEHAHWGKQTPREPDVAVPLIVRVPAALESDVAGRGGQTAALTEHVDMLPTLCTLAGVPVPDWVEGDSFVPLLRDPSLPWKPAAFAESRRTGVHGQGVRTPHYRYVRWQQAPAAGDGAGAPPVLAEELYDHGADPAERHNLMADQSVPASVLQEMRERAAAGWVAARPEVPA